MHWTYIPGYQTDYKYALNIHSWLTIRLITNMHWTQIPHWYWHWIFIYMHWREWNKLLLTSHTLCFQRQRLWRIVIIPADIIYDDKKCEKCWCFARSQFLLQSLRVCVHVCVCMHVHVCFHIKPCVNCFSWTVLYMCTEYCILVKLYHVSAQGIDECMINVHYYY